MGEFLIIYRPLVLRKEDDPEPIPLPVGAVEEEEEEEVLFSG